MRITNLYINELEIEDSCPKCYVISSTNYGKNLHMSDLPEKVEFTCRNMECQNEWTRRADQYWYMLSRKTSSKLQ